MLRHRENLRGGGAALGAPGVVIARMMYGPLYGVSVFDAATLGLALASARVRRGGARGASSPSALSVDAIPMLR